MAAVARATGGVVSVVRATVVRAAVARAAVARSSVARSSVVPASVVVALRTIDATRTRRTLLVAVVVGPILQLLFLAAVAGPGRPAPLAVGVTASLLLAVLTPVDAVATALARMRQDEVLATVLLSARSAALLWLGPVLAGAAVGVPAGLVSLVVAVLLIDPVAGAEHAVGAIVLVCCAALAGSGCGLAVGVLGLRSRDGLAWVGPFAAVVTVLGGVVAPVDALPPALAAVARVLPLGQATDAARTLLAEGVTGGFALQTAAVVLIGGAWFGLGLLGWAAARRALRRTGGVELL